MIDFGSFNTVVRGDREQEPVWVLNPHPKVAEQQMQEFGYPPVQVDIAENAKGNTRSPYPEIVEAQFLLGIK